MKLIVFTPSGNIENEHIILGKMLDMGLPTLHVRKPKLSTENLTSYLNRFTPQQRKKIVIHNHHKLILKMDLKGIHVSKHRRKRKFSFWLTRAKIFIRRGAVVLATSCKSLSSLDETYNDFNYVILSPVFINNQGLHAGFNYTTLKRLIPAYPNKVVARGGATLESIEKARELGFSGIVFQRYVWQHPNPVEAMKNILDKFHELGIAVE